MPAPKVPLAQRLWSRTVKTDSCWLWQGALSQWGYGRIRADAPSRRTLRAHIVSYELTNGKVPRGLFVLHSCDVRHCVNPAHLFLGDHDDNMRDMKAKGRAASGFDNGRHTRPERTARGEQHGRAKLTREQVRDIRRMYATGEVTQLDLATYHTVSRGLVAMIVRGEVWRGV